VTFLDQLRQHTRPHHDSLERDSAAFALATTPRYRAVIAAYYGYIAPIEAQLSDFRLSVDAAFGCRHARTRFLMEDLEALGYGPGAITRVEICPYVPILKSRAAAMGCAYVIEGSAASGRVIGAAVAANLGITPGSGGRFFHGWGDAADRRWREFTAEAEAFAAAAAPGEPEQTIAAAVETFTTFRRWLRHGWEKLDEQRP